MAALLQIAGKSGDEAIRKDLAPKVKTTVMQRDEVLGLALPELQREQLVDFVVNHPVLDNVDFAAFVSFVYEAIPVIAESEEALHIVLATRLHTLATSSNAGATSAAADTGTAPSYYICRGNPFSSRGLGPGHFRIKSRSSLKITPLGRHQLLSMGSTPLEISFRTIHFLVSEEYRVELERCYAKRAATMNKRVQQKQRRRQLEDSVKSLGVENPSSSLASLDRNHFYPALLKKPDGTKAYSSAREAVDAVDPGFAAKKSRTIVSHMTPHAITTMEFLQSTTRHRMIAHCEAAGRDLTPDACKHILKEVAKGVASDAQGVLWTGRWGENLFSSWLYLFSS